MNMTATRSLFVPYDPDAFLKSIPIFQPKAAPKSEDFTGKTGLETPEKPQEAIPATGERQVVKIENLLDFSEPESPNGLQKPLVPTMIQQTVAQASLIGDHDLVYEKATTFLKSKWATGPLHPGNSKHTPERREEIEMPKHCIEMATIEVLSSSSPRLASGPHPQHIQTLLVNDVEELSGDIFLSHKNKNDTALTELAQSFGNLIIRDRQNAQDDKPPQSTGSASVGTFTRSEKTSTLPGLAMYESDGSEA